MPAKIDATEAGSPATTRTHNPRHVAELLEAAAELVLSARASESAAAVAAMDRLEAALHLFKSGDAANPEKWNKELELAKLPKTEIEREIAVAIRELTFGAAAGELHLPAQDCLAWLMRGDAREYSITFGGQSPNPRSTVDVIEKLLETAQDHAERVRSELEDRRAFNRSRRD